jgi:tRNA (Thr-GGU) A37 N-methylase
LLHKVSAERLRASQQAVVGVREGEQGKESEGLPATRAKAASDPNPVVMFIVRLLAPATVADDGIAFANRESPQHDVLDITSPVRFELVRRGRKWDKKNRGS